MNALADERAGRWRGYQSVRGRMNAIVVVHFEAGGDVMLLMTKEGT